MYFLEGLESRAAAMVLLPGALSHAMSGTPELEVHAYRGLPEILRWIEDFRPDTVILASGYVLPLNTGLGLLDLAKLLRRLRRGGVTVLTSDPFLGLLEDSLGKIDFRELRPTAPSSRGRIWTFLRDRSPWFLMRYRYIGPLFLARYLLRGIHHIYPAPVERLRSRSGTSRISFRGPAEPRVAAADRHPGQNAPLWMFILSKTDFDMQCRAHGERFVRQVLARIEDGLASGRRVLLICPDELARAVRQRSAERVEVVNHASTSFAGYMSRLMEAEYVFYWNMFSFSVLHRILGARPAMFFDRGHAVRILPDIGEQGVRLIYDGWSPPLLDIDMPLAEMDLACRARETSSRFGEIAAGLLACPGPDAVLAAARGQGKNHRP